MSVNNVLLLDDDQDLCSLMGMIFDDLGIKSTIISSYAELEKIDIASKNFDIAFLDVNLGTDRTGIDAFNLLKAKGFERSTVFFTGHARNYPMLQDKLKLPNVSLLEKPASMESIEKILKG